MAQPYDEQKFTAIAAYLIGLQATSLQLCHTILCFWWIICNIRESARFPKVSLIIYTHHHYARLSDNPSQNIDVMAKNKEFMESPKDEKITEASYGDFVKT
jgi:hypothetical protein